MLPEIERGKGFAARDVAKLVGRPDPVILDIGANDGASSRAMLRRMPQATIFAFEPDPRAIAKFRARTASDRITLIETAVGSTDGSIVFHHSGGRESEEDPLGWDQSGSIRPPKEHIRRYPDISFERTSEVQVCRLDSWAARQGLDRIDFVWADVQGAEDHLVAGGRETLARTPYFYTECYSREMYAGQLDLVGLLALLPAFVPERLFPANVLLVNRGLSAPA